MIKIIKDVLTLEDSFALYEGLKTCGILIDPRDQINQGDVFQV